MLKVIILSILISCWCSANTSAQPLNQDLCHLKTKYALLFSSADDKSYEPSIQLLKMLLLGLIDINRNYLYKALDLTEQVLNDPVIKNNDSRDFQEYKHDIKVFKQKYSSCQDISEFFDLASFFSAITNDFYEMQENDNLTFHSRTILNTLEKYKVTELDKEYEKSFLELADHFFKKFEEVKDKLEDDLKKWGENFKLQKTFQEKALYFFIYAKSIDKKPWCAKLQN
ncbi:uncharacterized protein ACRADG_004019 [Cochliomyia hominivorax]